MPFIPVNKEEQNKNLPRVSVNLDLVGEPAVKFKALCESSKLSGKDLIHQMAIYCLEEDRATNNKVG